MSETIVILDFGSQYTQVIARRVRECNVYSVIIHFNTPATEIAAMKPAGIILSGGPSSVYAADAPLPDRNLFALGVPVLGVCYGVQLFAHFLGGKVEKGLKREYGKGTLTVKDASCALFAQLPKSLQVWNSHGDKLTKIPNGFKPVAVTENSEYAAIENREKKFFGLQFHPEVVHTPRGKEIISNFVHGVCGCGKSWTMRNYVEQAVEEIRAQVGQEKVILGLSGGVDSSVAAALLHKAIGDQLTCIFVNNGVLRAREAEVVQQVFGKNFRIKLQYQVTSRGRGGNGGAARQSRFARPEPHQPGQATEDRVRSVREGRRQPGLFRGEAAPGRFAPGPRGNGSEDRPRRPSIISGSRHRSAPRRTLPSIVPSRCSKWIPTGSSRA